MSEKHYPNLENELIKFLYKETSPEEREMIVPTLFTDDSLTGLFNELLDTKEQLEELSVEDWIEINHIPAPSKEFTSNIMAYAKW